MSNLTMNPSLKLEDVEDLTIKEEKIFPFTADVPSGVDASSQTEQRRHPRAALALLEELVSEKDSIRSGIMEILQRVDLFSEKIESFQEVIFDLATLPNTQEETSGAIGNLFAPQDGPLDGEGHLKGYPSSPKRPLQDAGSQRHKRIRRSSSMSISGDESPTSGPEENFSAISPYFSDEANRPKLGGLLSQNDIVDEASGDGIVNDTLPLNDTIGSLSPPEGFLNVEKPSRHGTTCSQAADDTTTESPIQEQPEEPSTSQRHFCSQGDLSSDTFGRMNLNPKEPTGIWHVPKAYPPCQQEAEKAKAEDREARRSQRRCQMTGCKLKTVFYCQECNVSLCMRPGRMCFSDYHHNLQLLTVPAKEDLAPFATAAPEESSSTTTDDENACTNPSPHSSMVRAVKRKENLQPSSNN